MKCTFESWFEQAKRGTSGDMVDDILYDWKEEREELAKTVTEFINYIKNGENKKAHVQMLLLEVLVDNLKVSKK